MLRLRVLPPEFRVFQTSPLDRASAKSAFHALGLEGNIHFTADEPTMPIVAIVRDFEDPLLELIRLLKEASEIEHSLMIQYIFAYSTVRARYQLLAGFAFSSSRNLLGVAVQEMQHLAQVNGLLSALGATPNIDRQDLPYEADIYPFALRLEALTRYSTAKYLYTEAPPGKLDPNSPDGDDRAFVDDVMATLGQDTRPNHLGSLYSAVLQVMREVSVKYLSLAGLMSQWEPRISAIKDQGEIDHYLFFKSVFLGTHEGFQGQADVWNRPEDDPLYPSQPVALDRTAYQGFANTISDEVTRQLAWLSNLHYWLVLALLQIGYRHSAGTLTFAAKNHMTGPLLQIGQALPQRGVGPPFDRLSMSYDLGWDLANSAKVASMLAGETEALEGELREHLPVDYAFQTTQITREVLSGFFTS